MDQDRKLWICNTIFSKRQRRIMPTNRFWRTRRFLFLSVSAILILLFHRLLALQVGIVPCTRNTYKPWTFIFKNSADPLWAPPPYIDWTLAWHEILHTWNERAAQFVRVAKIESWSRMYCGSYWKLASHVVQRPTHHWIRKILHWQPVGQKRLGRPKLCWESKLEMYCRYQGLAHWEVAAQNCEVSWKQPFNTFSDFCCQ